MNIINFQDYNNINDIITTYLYNTINNDIVQIMVEYIHIPNISEYYFQIYPENYEPSGSINFSRIYL